MTYLDTIYENKDDFLNVQLITKLTFIRTTWDTFFLITIFLKSGALDLIWHLKSPFKHSFYYYSSLYTQFL